MVWLYKSSWTRKCLKNVYISNFRSKWLKKWNSQYQLSKEHLTKSLNVLYISFGVNHILIIIQPEIIENSVGRRPSTPNKETSVGEKRNGYGGWARVFGIKDSILFFTFFLMYIIPKKHSFFDHPLKSCWKTSFPCYVFC